MHAHTHKARRELAQWCMPTTPRLRIPGYRMSAGADGQHTEMPSHKSPTKPRQNGNHPDMLGHPAGPQIRTKQDKNLRVCYGLVDLADSEH